MPELPEVEIVKQSLAKKIEQKKIKKVIITNRNLRFKIPLKFEELLQNKIIKKVTRFSKYLILNFSNGSFCLIHLGMSGTIHLIEKNNLNKFTNTSFYNSSNFKGILNLKFLFVIITFLIFFFCIFLANDCLTISTSGNSGI